MSIFDLKHVLLLSVTPRTARLSFCSDYDFMLLSAFHRTNGSRSPIANDADALEGRLRRGDQVFLSKQTVVRLPFFLSFPRLCED